MTRDRRIVVLLAAVALLAAAALVASLSAPRDRVYLTPVPHGCPEGSDLYAVASGVPYTIDQVTFRFARCDE